MSSSEDHFDFYHKIARSKKRYVVACVKTYDYTGNYISLKTFKKENRDNKFRFNQNLTLSMHELEKLGQNMDATKQITLSKNRVAQSKKSFSLVSAYKEIVKVVAADSKNQKKTQRVIMRTK